MSHPIATLGLLPHGQPMHLIDEVLHYESSPISGTVTAEIRGDGPYFGPEGFEEHWLIEICAQASAATYLLARRDLYTKPPRGYLVSVREFRVFETPPLKANDTLEVDVFFEVEATPLGQSRCLVRSGARDIAEAEMSFLIETEG